MAAQLKKLPNIVFVMADDMGFGDVGCFNRQSKIPTPHMDRLAADSVRFTDAHSGSSVCTPSRYGVLTGRYCWRTGLKSQVYWSYEKPLIEPERLTLASLLKKHGYRTACIGKWHLGLGWGVKKGESLDFSKPLPWSRAYPSLEEEEKIDFEQRIAGGPTELGFDSFYGTSGACTAMPPYAFIENDHVVDIPTETEAHPPGSARWGKKAANWRFDEVDLIITEKAVSYIESRGKAPHQPFFLYLNPSAPHEPCLWSTVPASFHGRSDAGPRGDLVVLFDWIVGEVARALEKAGAADNTLLIVTSDNGALPGNVEGIDGRAPFDTFGHKSCGDWRGYKTHIWDGGHRVPLIIRWPGIMKPGVVSTELVCLNDFLAAGAAIVGDALPENAGEDSYNILPALTGTNAAPIRDALVHHSYHGVVSVRQGVWKLIMDTKGSGGCVAPIDKTYKPGAPGQLYDLAVDPGETDDLYGRRPEVVERLSGLMSRYRREGRSSPKME